MSDYKIEISAFTPPPHGYIKAKDGKMFLEDFRTKERYQQYRDCGFDEIMFSGETKYQGEDYEISSLKRMLDLSAECDLSALVFDERILSLSVKAQNNVIGEIFKNEKELDAFIEDCVKEYRHHPAFGGFVIVDEPMVGKSEVLREIADSARRVVPEAFVHTCFSPLMCIYGGSLMDEYFGKADDPWEAYANYIDKTSIESLGYWGFDSYPFKYWEKKPMDDKFLRCMQFVSKRCQKNQLPFHMTIQSYAKAKKDSWGNDRLLDEADLNWQANVALGFGAKKIYYYTYWRFTTRLKLVADDIAIMDDDGSKILYDETQRNNALIRRIFKEVGGAQYVASQLLTAEHDNPATDELVSEDLGIIASYQATAPVLVNKLQDSEKDIYMFLNARDPHDKVLNQVNIQFKNPKETYLLLVDGRKMVVEGKEELTLSLKPGEAVWFLDL